MPSTRSGASYDPSSSAQKGHRHDYGRSQSVTEGQGAETFTRSLSGHLQSQPEGLQQYIAAQRVPDRCRSVEKPHELLPHCEKTPGPSQHLQVTQWMASIDGKEEHDALNRRMEGKNPPPPKKVPKTAPVDRRSNYNMKKEATTSEQGQRKGTGHKALQPGLQDSTDSTGCH
ncbi:hypothetical protein O181_110461 [Austropuccinia psidii MF-1]|uniref:Uncharacterized protein n=1 Tax=Austropuccinia psidii MF-1 TaxID=1389203 RepID=A0A9Q3JZ86_9BASI|nr:hypothetical protein [Austropuccinia psidii MF-1]